MLQWLLELSEQGPILQRRHHLFTSSAAALAFTAAAAAAALAVTAAAFAVLAAAAAIAACRMRVLVCIQYAHLGRKVYVLNCLGCAPASIARRFHHRRRLRRHP